ncbi:MAG: GspH/FimT family pseudopilin [Burkholderiaceae bacterium]|nr:GspH/FimT family pseudopilin [Burkholderiaceae bacterium]
MKANLTRRFHVRGFTMIELMVTIAVAAILLTIGVPSFRMLIDNQRLTTSVNDLFTSINMARAEAAQRGTRVDLAPLDGTTWSKGWAVFIDNNGDQKPNFAVGGDEIIFSTGPVPDGITISTNLADGEYIAYGATGRTRNNAGGQIAGTISFTQDGTVKRLIKLNFLGRPVVCDPVQNPTTCKVTTDGN